MFCGLSNDLIISTAQKIMEEINQDTGKVKSQGTGWYKMEKTMVNHSIKG